MKTLLREIGLSVRKATLLVDLAWLVQSTTTQKLHSYQRSKYEDLPE